jgi:2'-5' RNA ligase
MDSGEGEGYNAFAVVGYLPEPLAGFVDSLRRELVPGCTSKAHVTILPPRPLDCSRTAAAELLRERMQGMKPFGVELQEVRRFTDSDVIYISIGAGYQDLEWLHRRLDFGHFQFFEPWFYHPHVTLARQIEPAQVAAGFDLAARRWREFRHLRSFTLEHVTLVQSTSEDVWIDLEDCDLQAAHRF